ncbi:hypothetical protein [Streptomyces sp. NPDC058620]|uniref:hypothetical protein n=1 Tax=Streptomyces sp. NPDC058620 TaxID=3346560 RepID=UPI00365A0E22
MDDAPLIIWGRCRSGKRWFWTAREVDGTDTHGWAPSRDKAARRANAAAVKLAAGRYANIRILHGVADDKLKALNTAKRNAKPPTGNEDTAANGYLYAIEPGHYDANDREWIHSKVIRLPIVKKTPKRIYYSRPDGPFDFELGYVDRQALEGHGSVSSSRYREIFAEPPKLDPTVVFPQPKTRYAGPDIKQLKAAMAAAHPDRGGTDAEFIAAHTTYKRALARHNRMKEYA